MDNEVYIDDKEESEKQIAENDYYNEMNKIANSAFNEGYLSKVEENYEDKYNEGFTKGVEYSLNYGKLFGLIELFKFMMENCEIAPKSKKKIEQSDKDEIANIQNEMENYQEKITEEQINELSALLWNIINKYYS